VSLLGGVRSVTTVLAEIPTGYVADRIGRRNALVVGAAVQVVCMLAFGLLETFPAFAAVFAVGVWVLAPGEPRATRPSPRTNRWTSRRSPRPAPADRTV